MADKVVLDSEDIRRTLVRIAHEIVERTAGEDLAIVGIHRRGAVLAARLHELISGLVGADVPLGDIVISFYRDDLTIRGPSASPARRRSSMPLISTSSLRGARSCSSTTCSIPAVRSGPRSTPSSTTVARTGCSSRC